MVHREGALWAIYQIVRGKKSPLRIALFHIFFHSTIFFVCHSHFGNYIPFIIEFRDFQENFVVSRYE